MTETKQSRGFAGAVLKLLRAGDYELTVTGRTQVSPHYVRLSFAAGGLLEERSLHPTQWIRMWFSDGDKLHQRGYTLVNPDPVADTVEIERDVTETVRRNISAFQSRDWRPYFSNLKNGAILCDIDSRAVHFWRRRSSTP